jgi:limonene 1,2-monooxygenase
MRSYELFARHVAPRFQGSLDTLYGSNEFTKTNRIEVVGRNVEAVRRAFTDVGREVPEGFEQRTLGARDLGSENVDKPKSKKKSKKP